MSDEKVQEVIPVKRNAKDTFFKKIYETEERRRSLAAFLTGADAKKIDTANVRPVLFGNRENDLAFLCDDVIYIMMENQASESPNVPYRMLEYATAGLRSMVDSEGLLYGRKKVYFPVPKLYMLQTGLENDSKEISENILYTVRLSDSFIPLGGKYRDEKPDLEAAVHVYDFRMRLGEILLYIEQDIMPGRFMPYSSDIRNYALVANGLTYMQRVRRDKRYTAPSNISTAAEYMGLMLERGIFVDLLSDKEVCDMTMAQFSRDDILIYQGREEGRAEGRAEAVIELLEDIGCPSDALREYILGQQDMELLKKWHKAAARAGSIEEFEKAVGTAVLK